MIDLIIKKSNGNWTNIVTSFLVLPSNSIFEKERINHETFGDSKGAYLLYFAIQPNFCVVVVVYTFSVLSSTMYVKKIWAIILSSK